ncbi:MAG: tol-pal system protein YbgF [Paracoccaceae bacterium]
MTRIFKSTGLGLCMALTVAFASATSVPAVAQQWQGSSSPEDLRYRLDILDAELADIRARLGGTVGSVAPSARASTGDAAAMEGELRRLTAQVERMQNQITQLSQEAERRFGDIEFRLTELEGGDPSQAQSQPLLPDSQNSGVGISGGQENAAVSASEQGDYERAVEDVRQGRFDQAEDRLRQFLTRYPGSPLTGDAWYWLGESLSVRGIQAEAAKSYLNGYNSDRAGPQAPYNLLKLGMTLGRLGQLNEACLTLREVRSQYPNSSDAVSQADAEADQLTCG